MPTAPVDHFVWFYEERAHLIAKVAEFAADGLRAGEQVILIATQRSPSRHRRTSWRSPTARHGAVCRPSMRSRRAARVLPRRCDRPPSLRQLRRRARPRRRGEGPVRAFGEMVALLWADGAVREAIELEALWCEFARIESFSLLAPIRRSVVLDEPLHAPVNAVCALHSEIRIGEGGEPTTSMRVYPATPEAVR